MNIKSFTPKHMSMDEARAKAIHYKGTFTELVDLVNADKITLITAGNGEVTGIWVDSGTGDLLVDEMSGRNFASTYSYTFVMSALEKIFAAKTSGKTITSVDEVQGTYTLSDGSVMRFKEAPREATAPKATVEGDTISLKDLGLKGHEGVRVVKKAIARHTGRFVAKGTTLTIVDGNVTGIVYGRKATAAELA